MNPHNRILLTLPDTASFEAFAVTGLADLHIGRATMKAGNDIRPVFHSNNNHALITPESFVAICDDIKKLALSMRASVTNEDDNVIYDVLMKSIAMGSTNAQISAGTITQMNRQFGIFFLQLWGYRFLFNDCTTYSRVPKSHHYLQSYYVNGNEYSIQTGMRHNAECIYRYLLTTTDSAFRLTFPPQTLERLPAVTLQQLLNKLREWQRKFETGLTDSYVVKASSNRLWIHHFRLLQGADLKWTIRAVVDFAQIDKNKCDHFKLTDYLKYDIANDATTWVIPPRKKRD